jgi:hypothetical protein
VVDLFLLPFADLTTRSVQPHLPDSTVLQALMTSAGLPLYYRVSAEKVDGGVLNNLPTDMLDSTKGHILAFAFADDPYVKAPSNAIRLMFSMLNAAMANSTRLLKKQIGPDFVYTIPTKIDDYEVESMDIEGFIKFVKSRVAYKAAKEAAIKWTKERVDFLKQPPTPVVVEASSGPTARLGELSNSAQKLFDFYKISDNVILEASMIEVVAYCLDHKHSDRFDFVRFTDKVKVESGTRFIHTTELLSTTAASGRTVRFEIKNELDEFVDYTIFTILDENQKSKSYVIVFERPFSAGERYTVIQEEEVDKMMKPLLTYGGDYLSLGLSYSPKANVMEIRLAVPESFPKISQQNGTPENLRTLDVALDPIAQGLDDEEVIVGKECEVRIYGAERGYRHYGWRGGPCNRGDALRVVYRAQKVA